MPSASKVAFPPIKVSSPFPASTIALPSKVSFPDPPIKVLSLEFPDNESSPDPPSMFSTVLILSQPLSPVFWTLLLDKSTFTEVVVPLKLTKSPEPSPPSR